MMLLIYFLAILGMLFYCHSMFMAPSARNLSQRGFLIMKDDAAEGLSQANGGPTTVQPQNVNASILVDTPFRIRFLIRKGNNTHTDFFSIHANVAKTALGVRRITITSREEDPIKTVNGLFLVHQANTTEYDGRLGGGFPWMNNKMATIANDDAFTGLAQQTNSTEFELECCLEIDSEFVDDGDEMDVRVERSTNANLDRGYFETPTLTARFPKVVDTVDLQGGKFDLQGGKLDLS